MPLCKPLEGLSPQAACKEACMRIIRKHPDLTGLQCGFLAIDKAGNYGAYSIYAGFNFAKHDGQKNELVDAPFDRNW
ncbi:MAG: glycosylasparaginase, partial [Flavobacteriales bacterium]